MAIGDDFSIDRATGNIREVGGATNYTVLQFYEWLRDLGDDQIAVGNDEFDITDPDMASKAFDTIINLINGANIDDAVSQRLYAGSIIQNAGADIYDGIQIISPQGTYVDIIQDGAKATNFWTTGINQDAAAGISHQFLIKVRSGGADIDGRRLLGQVREWGQEYNEFRINGTKRGENVLPLATKSDLNNQTLIATIAAIADITNTEGYRSIDVDGNGTPENYYSEWDRGANTINTLYERMKWLTRRGSASTIYGLSGELFRGITHEIVVDTPTGTFSAVEPVSWSGGTGQMLAINSTTAPTKMWIQLLMGVAPTDNQVITGGTSTATCQVNVTVTERDIAKPFCGSSTGTAIIGAYGFGIEAADLSNLDRLTDLDNSPIQPPNNQSGLVSNLIVGDVVIVGPKDVGDAIDYNQLALSGALLGGEATITVGSAIPTDTPASGTIRVFNGTNYVRVTYTGWTGSQFTGCVGTPAAADAANVFVSYIDAVATGTSESFGAVYASDRAMFCRVRNATVPIKTFESAVTFGSSGFALSVIRNSDA